MCGGVSSACATDGTCATWCCTPGYECNKITSYYYQCQPANGTLPAPAPLDSTGAIPVSRAASIGSGGCQTVQAFKQCGGMSGECAPYCFDAVWPSM